MWIHSIETGIKELKVKELERLDMKYKCNPSGMGRYLLRRPNAFIYVYVGETREECN